MPYIQGVCIMGLCEPLLNPNLPEMIKWLKSSGYSISLTTNGTVMIKAFDMLRLVDDFVFSIDSPDPKTFEYLRGGAKLDKVLQNFRNVIDWKRANGLKKTDNPPIHINSVITRKNFRQMPELIKMLEPYADDLTYLMVDPISRPDYQTFEDPIALSPGEFKEEIAEYCSIAKQSRLKIIGFDYMLQPSSNWSICSLSWYGMFIEPNGDAYFCYDYRRVLGNVLKEDPLEVWNSKVAKDFRASLKTSDPPVQQCRCCNFARQGWQPGGIYDAQGKIKGDVK
jgi:radical SAM protein with 4Fe4S-binding SPASM domain